MCQRNELLKYYIFKVTDYNSLRFFVYTAHGSIEYDSTEILAYSSVHALLLKKK